MKNLFGAISSPSARYCGIEESDIDNIVAYIRSNIDTPIITDMITSKKYYLLVQEEKLKFKEAGANI